jgi:Holliday junction resolvase RusA-like endonuclease
MIVEIPGEPQGKGRPRFWQGHAVTPPATRAYEKLVAESWTGGMMHGAIKMEIWAFFKIPKSASKKMQRCMILNQVKPEKKPDIDNIQKIILDGLQGRAFEDDKQVIEITAHKAYGLEPRVVVEVKEITDEQC